MTTKILCFRDSDEPEWVRIAKVKTDLEEGQLKEMIPNMMYGDKWECDDLDSALTLMEEQGLIEIDENIEVCQIDL